MLMNKMNTLNTQKLGGKAVIPRKATVVKANNAASNARLETAPAKAAVKQGTSSQMFAATTTTAPASTAPTAGLTPGVMGGMAAMLGAGMLISKMGGGNGSGDAGVVAQLKSQTEALQRQLAATQNAMSTQHAQQAQALAKMLEAKGMSSAEANKVSKNLTSTSLDERARVIQKFFPNALPVDDYMNRVEMALSGRGFTGDNSIAMSNLCRDESCMILEDKIESVFGSCFSTHGLGGVLTCGSIGIMAGLSHSPVVGGKEQYVFFSFPHIAIDSSNEMGKISRPNRPGSSSACGALCACLDQFQSEGLESNCRVPGVHDVENPEFSILKQRLARKLVSEGCNPKELDLLSITQAAERTITDDLEHLISQAVDTNKANYAVFTGVQIHNWAADLTDRNIPSLEFVSAGKSYSVINGVKQDFNINQVPALAPRQLRLLGQVSEEQHPDNEQSAYGSTVQEIPRGYLLRRVGGAAGTRYVQVPSSN